MGRKKVIKELRIRTAILLVIGFICFLIGAVFTLGFLWVGGGPVVIFPFIIWVTGAFSLIMGFVIMNPHKPVYMRYNPDLLEQADELYANVVYEDEFIVCSNKHISTKRSTLNMLSFDDILGIYQRTIKYGGILTIHKELVLVSKMGDRSINVTGRFPNTVNALMQTIHGFCPNARIGQSMDEAYRQYCKEVQKNYMKQRKMR